MSTAYIATVLLVATLLIGPLTRIRGRQPAISTDLRRDVGIWCAIIGLLHVITGIQVHMGNPFLYFFLKKGFPQHLIPRKDLFGFANYTGLLATLILLMLVILSNDWSLGKLGSTRWKSLQRWNYALVILVFAHGFFYQIVLSRTIPYVIILIFLTVLVMVYQSIGYSKTKKILQARHDRNFKRRTKIQ